MHSSCNEHDEGGIENIPRGFVKVGLIWVYKRDVGLVFF